jgi:hypothetical protein
MDWRIFSSQRSLSFCSMGTRVGLIFFLSAAVPLNFDRVQNLMAEMPRGTPLQRNGQARMHQKPTDRVHPETVGLVLTAVDPIRDPDLLGPLSLVGQFRRVLQN